MPGNYKHMSPKTVSINIVYSIFRLNNLKKKKILIVIGLTLKPLAGSQIHADREQDRQSHQGKS